MVLAGYIRVAQSRFNYNKLLSIRILDNFRFQRFITKYFGGQFIFGIPKKRKLA